MKGHVRWVMDRAFAELWQPLTDHDDCPPNLFGEIYVGLSRFLQEPEPEYFKEIDGTIRDVAVRIEHRAALAASDPREAESLLAGLNSAGFASEYLALRAVTSTFSALADVAGDDMAIHYLDLLRTFVDRYSLRYYVDGEAKLWISFDGLATALFGELRKAAHDHPHLLQELNAFEHSLAECLADPVETRIKTVIQKQINVLEAFGSQHRRVTSNTLGRMLAEVDSWPHESLTDAAKNLYKFACDYPGIRHAGTYAAAARSLDLRDLAGVTLSLVGLVAYLADGFESHVGPAMQGEGSASADSSSATAPWIGLLDEGSVRP